MNVIAKSHELHDVLSFLLKEEDENTLLKNFNKNYYK